MAFECGLAARLLEEGLHAFALIVGAEQKAEAARLEWFLPGTAMRRVASGVPGEAEKSAQTGMDAAEIAYPADGLIVAIDPDIPLPDERLPLLIRH